ncbi:hypothetical protein JS533_004855 [Bifidobacterium amazonense]|uniref:Signal transduction histidine kinase subgroup 3 dimerisation and phosphoacceptor domain-containing protein n=1 Tax=Bifidobacterium amazonense TaxID=2809027 RepID=A0ABS9VU28_9BIFI|nr:hypothetical protein [Bifidobacterium amazonense]MCH9275603.1 hypothetical protein [Bifidobacterium amazonense]
MDSLRRRNGPWPLRMGLERGLCIAISWMGAALFALDWLNGIDLTASDQMKNAALMVLMLLLPFNPAVLGGAIVALSLALAYAIPVASIYWLFTIPCYVAAIVLGQLVRRPIPAIVVFCATQLLAMFGTVARQEGLRQFAFTYQSLVIAWAIGTFLGYAIDVQKRRTANEEKAQYRAKQLRILHILHDSVANDIVYALAQSKTLRDGLTDDEQLARADDIIAVLESGLAQLRRQVIEPTKLEVTETEDPAGGDRGDLESQIDASVRLHRTVQMIGQRLRQRGFVGSPQVNGDVAAVRGDVLGVIGLCVHELGGNMVKYGRAGEYAFVVDVSRDGTVTIAASNLCRTDAAGTGRPATPPTNGGLTLLRDELRSVGGSMSVSAEDGEWTVYIRIPDACGKDDHR